MTARSLAMPMVEPARPASGRIVLLAPGQLLPTEEFIESRVLAVARDILAAGVWCVPILVERQSLVIMDGHHRREFAQRHRFRQVPCLLLDYADVQLESRDPALRVTPGDVIARGLSRRPYPAKTTRHVLTGPACQACHFPLGELA